VNVQAIEGNSITLLDRAVDPMGHAGGWANDGEVDVRKGRLGQEILNATHVVGMVVRDKNARKRESMGLKVSQHRGSLTRVDHHKLVAAL
jgi:hypothetical protein